MLRTKEIHTLIWLSKLIGWSSNHLQIQKHESYMTYDSDVKVMMQN